MNRDHQVHGNRSVVIDLEAFNNKHNKYWEKINCIRVIACKVEQREHALKVSTTQRLGKDMLRLR